LYNHTASRLCQAHVHEPRRAGNGAPLFFNAAWAAPENSSALGSRDNVKVFPNRLDNYNGYKYTSNYNNIFYNLEKPLNFENWTIQLRKGLLELVVLQLLYSGRHYGYEMVKILKTIKGFRIREGNIYPILARLKTDCLVTIRKENSPDGPLRNSYAITGRGKKMLLRMNGHWKEIVNTIDSLTTGGAQ
jgi:PadR family transcriptional regulator PadR